MSINYPNGLLQKTGKSYTTDSRYYKEYDKRFQARNFEEYEFQGKKYIRFITNSDFDNVTLSNGTIVHPDSIYWISVEPIKWLVDEKADIALSKKLLFAGVQFKHERDYDGDFDKTDIKKFMDDYFSKEIVTDKMYSKEQIEENKSKEYTRKKNPYGFSFDNVSEEDIIRGVVESGVAVFLHGRSSEGKSARVKQLDLNCEIIYLRNATPESLNGKSVYNSETGEMIDVPPTWYKKIKKKCEDEPDKIHIVFFDEITNALPSIQGMAFNIVLDGEVNGIWKLPENCRIVAAGNDLNDSLAANTMAEPLFNRFAHVYINTTVDRWLKWASTPKEDYERLDYKKEELQAKIHPAIYAFIAYKGESVLRTPYNGEKPNADPRKWEMASKILYRTKSPEMLRALVGEDITRDFTNFCKQQVISLKDVINGNYNDYKLRMNVSEMYATALGLSAVDEEHFEIVREFMKQLSGEAKRTFETMWHHGDERRLEIIAELEMKELSEGRKR